MRLERAKARIDGGAELNLMARCRSLSPLKQACNHTVD
jgi:hypothetical protein